MAEAPRRNILEGKQSIMAALEARLRRFEVLLVAVGAHEEKLADLLGKAAELGVPIKRVAREELDSLAHGASHGGVVAVVSPRPRMGFEELLTRIDGLRRPPFLLLLEGVDDARNLGYIIRTAEAMGADAVLLKKHLWDFDETEVSRPSSGAYERLSLVMIDSSEALHQLKRRGIRLVGCIAGVKRTIHAYDMAQPICVALGGEKRGLSGATRSICDRFVTIPMGAGGGEGGGDGRVASSLSLSHAAAIVLAEVMRQRVPRGPAAVVDEAVEETPEEGEGTGGGGGLAAGG